MRRFLSTCTVSAFLLAASAWAATGFVEGMEDVPLMAGLKPMPADTVAFDTLRGRLVTAYASGAVDIDQIQAFYAATLPQLGWQTLSPGVFRREGEILRLDIDRTAGAAAIVRFTLSPN